MSQTFFSRQNEQIIREAVDEHQYVFFHFALFREAINAAFGPAAYGAAHVGQRCGAASSGEDESLHAGQFLVDAVDFPFDAGDAFGRHLALHAELGRLWVGGQVGAYGKELMLDEGQEIQILRIVEGCHQEADERVQLVDRPVAFYPSVRFRYALSAYE